MNINHYKELIDIRNTELIESLSAQQGEIEIKFDDYSILVSANVFNPLLGEGSEIMRQCKKHLYGKRVLEIGTGTGALSIMAARKSKKIIATDISFDAVNCARRNIERLNLNKTIEVRQGDLFDPVRGEKFDKIIFNPPFIEGKPVSVIENSYYDSNYETLDRFFENAGNYLTNDGEIILCFGSVGDINYLNWLILMNGFRMKFIANKIINQLQFFVYKIN